MLRLVLSEARNKIRALRAVRRARILNPGASISGGAILLGDVRGLKVGRGTEIDEGAVLDFRYGGVITLGENVKIYGGARLIPWGGSIDLGDNCGVNHYSILYGHGGLRVGKLTRFAAHCVVVPANHGFADLQTPIHFQPESKVGITIGDDIWVGAHSTILDGVTIGRGSVIAAGSVVTRDISEMSVVAGVPATAKRQRDANGS